MRGRLDFNEPFALGGIERIGRACVGTCSLFFEHFSSVVGQVRWPSKVRHCWCSIFPWSEGKIPSSGSLVDCHSAINAHVSRERLRRHDLSFLNDTCKGYRGT